jgi:hypothetical protein
MAGETLAQRLPDALPSYDDETDFAGWLAAHQDEIDALDEDLTAVQESLQVANATGEDLDLLGADFGILGRRRGRNDEAYRQYLTSLTQAYSGRGTPPGVRTAVAAGLVVDEADVRLREDFTNNAYEIELREWTAHRTGAVHELADLADPVAVERVDPLYYRRPTATANAAGGETVPTTLDASGLSSTSLSALSSGGTWNLSES